MMKEKRREEFMWLSEGNECDSNGTYVTLKADFHFIRSGRATERMHVGACAN